MEKNYKSKRHHYIPKFLIKGFTNDRGYVFVYDKINDRILKKPQSPKSIFFENHRNSVSKDDTYKDYNSIIEDELFQYSDNVSSEHIRNFQNTPISNLSLDVDAQAMFQFFTITLFWRIPYTDYGFKQAFIDSLPDDIDKEEFYENTKSNEFKIQRARMFNHTFNEMLKVKNINRKSIIGVSEFANDTFVLGDNPLIFETIPKLFSDLGYLNLAISISSNRIMYRIDASKIVFSIKEAVLYNCFVIELSKRYIVSGNYKLLQDSVKLYKAFKPLILFIPYDNLMFKMLKKEEDELIKRYVKAF